MPSHITVNGLGLTYKGTIGLSVATIPDVCKTPSPGGPIPLPYPNFANQSTLKNGTTTVFAKGKMVAVKGSQYGMSTGDEPGTVGGVKSNTFKQATDWITYSFDVKMDGKNACRHTDKKFHNNKNTVNLAGDVDPVAAAQARIKEIKCAIHKCDKKSYSINADSEEDRCNQLGKKKHSCVSGKLKGKEDGIYSETFVDMTSDPPNILVRKGAGVKNVFRAKALIGMAESYTPGSLRRPDVLFKDADGKHRAADAKFPCPDSVKKGTKTSGRMASPSSDASMLTGAQRDDYKKISGGKEPLEIQPSDCSAADCE